MEKNQVPNIFEYDNYRLFLKDYFKEQKKMRSVFSHRFFAQRAGFSSSSFCAHVIEGKRNLTPDSVVKMVKGLGLSGRHLAYFTALVQFNQAASIQEREINLAKMERLRKSSEFYRIHQKQFAYYDEWYYPVIRELVVYSNWNNDYVKLARLVQPAIPPEKARQAVVALVAMGLLEEKGDGTYLQTNQVVTASEVPASVTRKTRKELILKALESIETLSPTKRHVAGATIAMSEQTYKSAIEILDETRKKIIEMAATDTIVDGVYQLNIQAFPLSKSLIDTSQESGEGVRR
jgi:uncharacterized protein (TIGR02147 family)